MSNAAKGFFDGTRLGKQAKYGEASFELPILYLRDDFFGLYYTADTKKISEIIPSDKLTPVTMPNGRAVIAIMAYNYLETSIGSYGEVPVAIPVLFEKKQLPLGGFLPLMLQGAYPGFGVLVMHLPVTKVIARDAGRGEWGYTKFVADMDFSITPEFLECRMYEKDQFIFDLRVMRRGFHMPDKNPLITFSVKDRQLIRTTIPIKGVMRFSLCTKDSYVKFGAHPMAQSIQALDISENPFAQSFYTERAAILPSGEIVERNVKPLEGYMGQTRDARHSWKYTAD
jgi:hypothetical protein